MKLSAQIDATLRNHFHGRKTIVAATREEAILKMADTVASVVLTEKSTIPMSTIRGYETALAKMVDAGDLAALENPSPRVWVFVTL